MPDNQIMHQGKTIAQWEKDFNGEFTQAQLEKMIRGGCDLQKILMLGLDEVDNSNAKDIDDKQLFKGEEFFFNEASAEDIDAALAESTDNIVTTKDFVSQMKRNLANDSDKIMFRVNKKPHEVFDMHGKGGTFVVDLIPQVANSLNEDIIEDPDIDTAADLIDTINDATNGNVNSAIVKIEDNTGREYNITSISGYKGNLYIGLEMKNAIRESAKMKESTNMPYKNYYDKIISFIENGLLSWEEVGNECLQRMSDDEIKDMVQECGWDDDHASSLDESADDITDEQWNEAFKWFEENGFKVHDSDEGGFTFKKPIDGKYFYSAKDGYNLYLKMKDEMELSEGYNWRNGGYGGTGRSYRSFGELGAPRGKAISWFEVAELDPKARGKMKEWRVGPSNFPFKDLLYPERKYKVGTTVLRSKFLKAGDESGVKYIAVPSYLEAIWSNDEAAIELLNSLGIPLDLSFGYNKGEDFSGTYTV